LFATNQPPNIWRELTRESLPANADIAEFSDRSRGRTRIAAFACGRLERVIFVGPASATPRWDVVAVVVEIARAQ
jgi:hypothetical protein